MNEEDQFLISNNLESLFTHCYFHVSYIVRCSTLPLLLADPKASFDSLSGKFERLFLPSSFVIAPVEEAFPVRSGAKSFQRNNRLYFGSCV